jgi:hypothetical protein
MPKKKWVPRVGDKVTVKERQPAYNSPFSTTERTVWIYLEPGEVGIIGAVDVPAVRAPVDWKWRDGQWVKTYPRGRNPSFCCVDWIGVHPFRDGETEKHRTSCYLDEMILLEPAPEPD